MSSILPLERKPSIFHDTSDQNLSGARSEFAAIVGHDNINDDLHICADHSRSRWAEASPLHKPSMVIYPSTTDDVSEILKVCCRRRIPVTPFSGGTGLSGSIAATRAGICVDLSSMSKIWNLNETDMDVTVQPGVNWMDLNAVLREKGLFFPPDPAPGARIGGMVS